MTRTFMNRANRDKAWVAGGRTGRRSTLTGQNMHPMYVEDYEQETGIHLTAQDKGFGNIIYRTLFAHIYRLEDTL